MNIIDAGAANLLAGLQIDQLTKLRSGQITLDQLERFNNLTPEEREKRFGDWQRPQPAREAKVYYLKRLFKFKLGATEGKDTYATAHEVFRAYFDPDFENWGIVFSGVAPETEVVSDELFQNGKFSDFLGNIASELEKRRVLGSQFLKICRDTPDKLQGGSRANFFVLTKGDEKVAEDLSNIFVARVDVLDDGPLDAFLHKFRCDFVWHGGRELRVFCPQQ